MLEGCGSIFFIGIGGITMSSLAHISHIRGYRVGGSDRTETELTDRLPAAARGTLYLLAILAIAVFGVWGAGYSAQAFIYFQF